MGCIVGTNKSFPQASCSGRLKGYAPDCRTHEICSLSWLKRIILQLISCALKGQPLLEFKDHDEHTCHLP